ncbi:GGDEF domain-containing protein [Aurantivibrio plasticivorans]
MSTDNTQHWKEKYLNLIEVQEASEKTNAEQQELLRRMLVRVSLAADGLDPELDGALSGLRSTLKKDKITGLSKHLDGLEQEVIQFEQRKSVRQTDMQNALSQICEQLLMLQPDPAAKRRVKALSKRIRKLDDWSLLGELLNDLSAVQADLFQPEGVARPGKQSFLDRLLGSKSTTPSETTDAQVSFQHVSPATGDIDRGTGRPEVIATSAETFAGIDLQVLGARVAMILQKMLDDIEPAECVAEKISNAKQRVSRGLNWRDLVPTLEDVRDLIMQSHLAANDSFSEYLLSLNTELLNISKLLKLTGSAFDDQQAREAVSQNELSNQLREISQVTESATDLESLKLTIAERVKVIRDSMEKTQSSHSISNQIKELLQQVEALENKAQETTESLNIQREKARTDALTGLPNREAYNERSHQEWVRWSRYQNPTSMAVIDIDHFKNINDSYGHQTGDKVLKLVSKEFSKRLREVDFIARYGGEEFVVLLPETKANDALKALDSIRETVAELPFHFKEKPVNITVSIGVSEFKENDTVETLFSRADNAMYQAKNDGRNCARVVS